MSEATMTAPTSGGRPKVSKISEAVIRIAGNSQDGIQAIGGFLARLAGRSEQEVMTFMTIPSTISGGPSIFQVRIGSGEVLSAGDEADVLLCFYDHSYDNHISSLKRGGIVLYDSDHVKPNEELLGAYHHVGVPISSLTVEAIGGTFRQTEDEIAAISMAIGASYGGRGAVTGSSGPGISLKTEALGWAGMAEMPIVVIDVQRGGPSTGMPTSVEQSDLNIAIFGGHGDSPRVVLAPANVEDCFYTAIEAVNIARKYSVPVVILTDQAIATRIEACEEPNLEKVCQDISPDLTPVPDHKPYDLSAPDGVTRHAPRGTRIASGKYPVVTGLEHDEMGHPTGAPKLHMAMSAKRRKKLQTLATTLPKPKVYGPSEGNVLLVGWGSTQGPVKVAVGRAGKAGERL